MADILSTLRELRSLEEKRAHGTLSPAEEQRFQELQASVSSRGPKPVPVTPVPLAVAPAPVAAPDPAAALEEPPFVDADLTEDATEVRPEPMAEETVIQAAPAEIPPAESEATVVQAAPAELPPDEPQKPVPMSSAELRQWNASFGAAEAVSTGTPAATPDIPAPSATDWLVPTPLDAAPEAGPEASLQALPEAAPEEAPPEEAPPEEAPIEDPVSVPLEAMPDPAVSEPALPEPTVPEPTVDLDDAPMVWSEPTPPAPSSDVPLLDDSWSASMADIPPTEATSDAEPTRLTQASPSMDPTLADAYEPSPEVQRSSDSSSGVTSKRMTPIGEAFAAGESRVVVHMLGGVQKRGSLVDAHMNADFLELRLPDGEREMLSTAALKAVFFVVPIGQEVPKPVGDPVTVTLQDGHQLTGLSPDYQVGAVGFFLSPTDQRSRTAKIYIYAGAVKGIS